MKKIALPNAVGLIQSVEGLNRTKKLTFLQIRENISCLTAFETTVFSHFWTWTEALVPHASQACCLSKLDYIICHPGCQNSAQTGTTPPYIKLETQEPWGCSSSLSTKAWEIVELRLRKSQCFSPRPKARIVISLCTSVQSFSHIQLFVTPWTAAHQASLSFTVPQSLLKLMSIELMMSCNHLILCCHLLLLNSIFYQHQGFFPKSQLFTSGSQSFGASLFRTDFL